MALDLQKVMAATQAFLKLVGDAEVCIRLHEEAKIPVPPMLYGFIDESEKPARMERNAREPQLEKVIQPPKSPDLTFAPDVAKEGWIPFNVKDLGPQTIAKAILRAESALRIKDLIRLVYALIPDSNDASLYGTVTKLKLAGSVSEDVNGLLRLTDPDTGGVISGKTLWVPSDHITTQEAAFYRRNAVYEMLRTQPGLKTSEIVRGLEAAKWIKFVANKDAVKVDLQKLERAKKIVRVGNGYELNTKAGDDLFSA